MMTRKEFERQGRIKIIRESLKGKKQRNEEIDKKIVILFICDKWGVSMRTAKEYFEIADVEWVHADG